MKIAFRVDSGAVIGGGHQSRCLTLAESLTPFTDCLPVFISRSHAGNLHRRIRSKGFPVIALPPDNSQPPASENYETWIGSDWRTDARETLRILENHGFTNRDILIVDHYGLDVKWEKVIGDSRIRIGVIDDLANRSHSGLFLVDQTVGRSADEYKHLVNVEMEVFTGGEYSILREEFRKYRHLIESRRATIHSPLKILVNFGSSDSGNVTGRTLSGLGSFASKHEISVTAVLGAAFAQVDELERQVLMLDYQCRTIINTHEMARLMLDADLGIGAAGSATWERCAMGLPSLILKTAENQEEIVQRVVRTGAAIEYRGDPESPLISKALEKLLDRHHEISQKASSIINVNGASHLAEIIRKLV